MLGRDVQWVLGAEYRREAGSLVPDPRQAAMSTTGQVLPTTYRVSVCAGDEWGLRRT
jgi:hypothetical protein